VRNRADAAGVVGSSAAEIARAVSGGKGDRQVYSALRVLEEQGFIGGMRAGAGESIGVMRLVASARRIREELKEESDAEELLFLRRLWKLAGGEVIHRGVSLPPREVHRAGGGRGRSRDLIDRLQRRGFIEWTERYVDGLVVLDTSTPIGRLPIDWRALERRRWGDLRKLEEMQAYVYTEECRRAFVLRYFGEDGVGGDCGACDTCLGEPLTTPPPRGARNGGKRSR